MKIAITGGAGFIGSHLTAQLKAAGHEVVIIDINAEPSIDVTDEAALTNAFSGVDVIYNLAAEHRDDVRPVEKYYTVNGGGARAIVNAAKANNINRIIFTSTVAVYGLSAGASKETDTPAPFNDYGRSKLEAEEIFNDWASNDNDRTLVTLRLVATFGAGNRGNIYTLINQISRGKFVMVGNGRNHKSVAYVENVAAFLTHTLSLDAGQHIFNYADKPDLNMQEMVKDIRGALGLKGLGVRVPYVAGLLGGVVFDALAAITGKRFPISAIRVRKFCADTVVNADKVQTTGYKARHSLTDGLNVMIAAEFPKGKANE